MTPRAPVTAALLSIVATVLAPASLGGAQQPAEKGKLERLAPAEPPGAFVPGELLVRFTSSATPQERTAALRARGAEVERALPVKGLRLVRLAPGDSVRTAATAFERRSEVLYAEPNFLYRMAATPNDSRFGELWGMHNTGQTVNGITGTADADIDAPAAWDKTTGSSAIAVAIVDTGVAYDHPDLAPNLWTNPGESGGGKESNGIDDDLNGLVDDFRGWDYVGDDNDPRDLNGHGSHVAGTVAARGADGQGVAGVSWNSKLIPLRVLNGDGSGTNADITSAFAYAGAKGAKVANASLGGGGFSQAMLDAISGASGTLFVVAAGNAGTNNDVTPTYPCNYTATNLICVAATNASDGLASFSNYGATSVDLAAPGTDILSAQPAYEAPVFSDGFESDISSTWTTGGTNNTWARTNTAAGTGSFSLADSPAGNYANSTNSFARNATAFSLSGKTGCRLDYRLRLATESNLDVLWVERSTNATSWTTITGWSGSTVGAFFDMSHDFSALDGAAGAYIRYRLQTDSSVVFDGAYIDDVAIRCLTSTYDGDEFEFLSGTSMATPHVAGVAALVWSQTPSATPVAVKDTVLSNVDSKASLSGKTVTGGRLNADRSTGVAPAPPTISDTDPDSPSNDNNPRVKGSASADSQTIEVFTQAGCAGAATSGTKAQFEGAGIQVTVPSNQTTQLSARALNSGGTPSSCSSSRSYTEDSEAPPAPTISDTDPDSPSNDNNPRVKGSTSADSQTVEVFTQASCAGAAASGTKAAFEGAGIQVTVPSNQTTQLSARAVDPAGNPSTCSSASSYAEDSQPPQTTIDAGPNGTTNDSTPTFEFSSNESPSSFACRVDSGTFASCSSPHTIDPVADGPHTFDVFASDGTGNEDTSPASRAFTVSTQPPPACSDGVDNDGDGVADFPADPGCISPEDPDEAGPAAGGGDTTPPSTGDTTPLTTVDTTPPGGALSGARTQKAGPAVVVRAACLSTNEDCVVSGTGNLSVPGASKVFRLRRVTDIPVPTGGSATLRLRVPAKGLKAARRALRRGKRVSARITVTVADAAGNSTALRRTIRLRR